MNSGIAHVPYMYFSTVVIDSPGCKMCDDECNETQERDDQTNIGEGFQDDTIHMRGRANNSPCEILRINITALITSEYYFS